MAFLTQWSSFLSLLCLLIKGKAVWGECSMNGMEIEDGSFTLSNGLNVGSMLRYQCSNGYYPYPELAYRCQANNQWTPKQGNKRQRCQQVECPDPTVLQNGYILPNERKYFHGSVITYHCSSGYTLRGPFQRTCLENGKWNGSNSVCQSDLAGDCPDPGVPPGGSRRGNTFEIGETVEFSCLRNMILMGSEERECQLNGYWSGNEPSCYFKYTYDTAWEVTDAFSVDIRSTLSSNLVNETMKARSIDLTRDGTLNIFIALDISDSIKKEDFQNATQAVLTLINKIESFSVYPKYEIVFFSSKVYRVVDISVFYQPEPPALKTLLNNLTDFYTEREGHYGTDINAVFKHFLERLGLIREWEKERFREHHHVIILFSDGGLNTGGEPFQTVERIKNMVYMNQPEQREKHLDIYVFAIGSPIYDENLKPLTVGKGNHYYKLSNMIELQKTFDEIIDESEVGGRCGLYYDYGGKNRKFPWLMEITSFPQHCLGSLVSPRFVLTAAHCFKSNDKSNPVSVMAISGIPLEVKEVHKHPHWNIHAKVNQGLSEFYDYDVALIELVNDAPLSKSLRPICLPCTDETNGALRQTLTCQKQEQFLLKDEAKVRFLSKTRHREKVARLKMDTSRDGCIRKAQNIPNITTADVPLEQIVTENFLCTGGTSPYLDEISCQGESGGAVFKNYENRTIQVALVSWGTKQMAACKGDKEVYSDDASRDFHINLFKVVEFLKSFLGREDQDYAPLKFI